ncbi:MAG: hypothetical protein QGD90_00965 [Candidatus Hydrogenedentes bacterium]|nr:hypothetical protein [Candidatus Hydrogenedentota bacterium]
MKERALTVDAREANGLDDGSITLVVRVVDPQPEGNPREVAWNTCINEWVPWAGVEGSRHGWTRCGPSLSSPLGIVGDRLIATPGYHDEPPCAHRGCKSHVTHPCEGCGRKWGVTLLKVTDVRVVKLPDVTEEDAKATGILPLYWPKIDERSGRVGEDPSYSLALCKLFCEKPADAHKWLWLATVAKVTA